MQNQNEIEKINHFIIRMLPIVVIYVKTFLQSAGLPVEEKGRGLDMAFHIKADKKEVDFFLHNLLLEIATIDRDETPMRFDERLQDLDYLLDKTARLTHSKLEILFRLLAEENVDAAIDNIAQNAQQYERLRIWKFDTKPP